MLSGTGAPADTLGSDGDFYIDTAGAVLYGPKASGGWPAAGTSLVGATGPQGPAGPAGPQGPAGTVNITARNDPGFVPLGGGGKTVISLSVPAGSYLIIAKAILEKSAPSGTSDSADCLLYDPNQIAVDEAPAELVADANGIGEATIALAAGSGTSGGTYTVHCSDALGGAAFDMSMIAIKA